MADLILEARGLEYSYEDGAAGLCGADLAVAPGARLALLGANGAGKSTLLLHLNGILRPRHGEIRIDGRPVGYRREELRAWRRQVALVFQNPEDQLFAGTVYEDVSFGPLNLGLPEAEVRMRVEEALAALSIGDLRDRPPHLLSFGQKKRAAIAGAVAMRPSLLILDEPTAGLDPRGRRQLLALLRNLSEAGTTMVLATHDIAFAGGWANEAAVLCSGIVVRQDDPARILADTGLLERCELL